MMIIRHEPTNALASGAPGNPFTADGEDDLRAAYDRAFADASAAIRARREREPTPQPRRARRLARVPSVYHDALCTGRLGAVSVEDHRAALSLCRTRHHRARRPLSVDDVVNAIEALRRLRKASEATRSA